jgi:hypothetical protein
VDRFVQWDSIEVRISGEKLTEMVRTTVAGAKELERIDLRFLNGRMFVEGTVRKYIAVPFSIEVTEIEARGTTIRIPLHSASAFGVFPIPRFLFGLAKDRLPKKFVTFEEPATLVFSLDRFLPTFISADIQRVWIIDGGLAVTLGKGGADLPAGGLDGNAGTRS